MLAGCLLFFGSAVEAHETRPLYIEITEMEEFVTVFWASPPTVSEQGFPSITLGGCRAVADIVEMAGNSNFDAYRCDGEGQKRLRIDYPSYNPSISTMVNYKSNGESHVSILEPSASEWALPSSMDPAPGAARYFSIGVLHILNGTDHLLFLGCLIFIARTPARIIATVTSFTLAHSLTLSLTVLDVVETPVTLIEAIIALSIVFVAGEVVRNDRRTITWRRPIVAASAFGLFHGVGFALFLTDVGVPQGERFMALLLFNLGVEAGQLLVVLMLMAVGSMAMMSPAGRHLKSNETTLQTICGYALGGVAAVWFWERIISAA